MEDQIISEEQNNHQNRSLIVEITPINILIALEKSLSPDTQERKEGEEYLKGCEEGRYLSAENDNCNEFYLYLCRMIKCIIDNDCEFLQNIDSFSLKSDMILIQLILYLKNSTSRNIRRKLTKSNCSSEFIFNDELKTEIKGFILELICYPVKQIPENIFAQLLEIAKIFVKFDFPKHWQELNNFFIKSLDSIIEDGIKDKDDFKRFLELYMSVMKEQSMKKIDIIKGSFLEVSIDHLNRISQLAALTDFTKSNIFGVSIDKSIDLSNNEDTVISIMIDKLILTNIFNGFDNKSLDQSREENLYVAIVTHFCDKLSYIVEGIKSLKSKNSSSEIDCSLERNLINYLETLLKNLSKIMKRSPLVFINSFDRYCESIFDVLFNFSYLNSSYFNCCRYANKTIIDVIDIDMSKVAGECSNINKELEDFKLKYCKIFQDCNVQKLLNFIACNYLLISSIECYSQDPEGTTSMFQHELLICEKIANNFFSLTSNWLSNCLTCIIETKIPIISKLKTNLDTQDEVQLIQENEFIEDAIFSIAGNFPKIYHNKNIHQEMRFSIEPVLDYTVVCKKIDTMCKKNGPCAKKVTPCAKKRPMCKKRSMKTFFYKIFSHSNFRFK